MVGFGLAVGNFQNILHHLEEIVDLVRMGCLRVALDIKS
jgi:hypothetical protein